MGTLFEGFQILCTDYAIFWEKGGIVFKGGHYIREEIIQGSTVVDIFLHTLFVES